MHWSVAIVAALLLFASCVHAANGSSGLFLSQEDQEKASTIWDFVDKAPKDKHGSRKLQEEIHLEAARNTDQHTNAAPLSVTGFTLIDATTNQPIQQLSNGDTIDLADVGLSLNIRADVMGQPGSVRFDLNGIQNYWIENILPYALFGDKSGDYFVGSLSVGKNKVTATPYRGSMASGEAGASMEVMFNVVMGSPKPTPSPTPAPTRPPTPMISTLAVTSFSLINAITNEPIQQLSNGDTVDLAVVGSALNIRANVLGKPGSVHFKFNEINNYRVENVSPYALFGDYMGDYVTGSFSLGENTLIATPYEGSEASGATGVSLIISFNVVSNPTPKPTPMPTPKTTPIPTYPPTTEPRTDAPTESPTGSPTGSPTELHTEPPTVPDLCAGVTCPSGEACDPVTGACQDVEQLVPCVAVIDEWSNIRSTMNSKWESFRTSYPRRPFCLLIPEPQSGFQTLPTAFEADTFSGDGIDRTIWAEVTRDGEGAPISDWFSICELEKFSSADIQFVGLFYDTSGSMRESTAAGSLEKFEADLTLAGLTFQQVFDSREDWITPFETSLIPSVSTQPTPTDPTSNPPTESPTEAPTGSPTESPNEPTSLPPTESPTASPTEHPTKVPSVSPTASPTVTPDEPTSLPPTETPTASPTEHPTKVPSVSPTASPTVPPDEPTSSPPTESPTVSPTMPETEPPTESPTEPPTDSGAGLILELSTVAITAGDSIVIFPVVTNDEGNPVEPPPAVIYEIGFVTGEASGTVPVESLGVINTFEDTRGIYTVSATVSGTSVTAAEDFVVFMPAMNLYSELSSSYNGIDFGVSALAEAVPNDDIPVIQTTLDALRERRDAVDRDALRLSAVFAPEDGFLPTLSQLAASGFPETADDASLQSTLANIVQNIKVFYETVELAGPDEDVTALEQLNDDLQALVDELLILSPTVHGWVAATESINYLYAIVIPNLLYSVVDRVESEILSEGIGVRRRVGSLTAGHYHTSHRRTFVSLTGFASASAIRMNLVKKIYGPVIKGVIRSAVLLSASALIQSYSNKVNLSGIITGASLSFHVFEQPNSLIEVGGVNTRYPERNVVLLIGSAALAAVEELIVALNPLAIKDVVDYIEGIIEATKGAGQAYSDAKHVPDSALGGFLVLESGFKVVNVCASFLCQPQPVIVIVYNPDSGGTSSGIFNFITPRSR